MVTVRLKYMSCYVSVSPYLLIGCLPFSASKKQLAGFISTLRGHVAPLLRHMVGSVGMYYRFGQYFAVVHCLLVFNGSPDESFQLFFFGFVWLHIDIDMKFNLKLVYLGCEKNKEGR